MDADFIKSLKYQNKLGEGACLPAILQEVIYSIEKFFHSGTSNKLCIILPCKEYSTQWVTFPLALQQLKSEFRKHKSAAVKDFSVFKRGQKLLLNNKAVVEWISGDEDGITFKTKGNNSRTKYWENTSGDVVKIPANRINNLRPAPESKKVLSSREAVYQNLTPHSKVPIDLLLNIDSNNNFLFQKEKLCLVSKFRLYEEFVSEVFIDGHSVNEYISTSQIDDDGMINGSGPFIITNDLSNLCLYLTENKNLSKIVIDGFQTVFARASDFADIDSLNLPTIVISDLSELDLFSEMKNYGFEIQNWTSYQETNFSNKKVIFTPFLKKLDNFTKQRIHTEQCDEPLLNSIVKKIHSIRKDQENTEVNNIKIALVQFLNKISRTCCGPANISFHDLSNQLQKIEYAFLNNKRWFAEYSEILESVICDAKRLLGLYTSVKLPKCQRLDELILKERYDYLICLSDDDALTLQSYLSTVSNLLSPQRPRIITVQQLRNDLLDFESLNVLVVGWLKHENITRIVTCLYFSKITFLFYKFEGQYYNSLARRSREKILSIYPHTADGLIKKDLGASSVLDSFFSIQNDDEVSDYNNMDVVDFELRLENAQYSRYTAKSESAEAIKAKRIDFENDEFLYAAETHKFLILGDIDTGKNEIILKRKVESLQQGDIIAFINTDRDILADLVKKRINDEEFHKVQYWTNLWKQLLKDYYKSIGCDFKKLVNDLREYGCVKHAVTIKTWLFDENRIGPDDDADLICIALLAESEHLNENVQNVRSAIRRMTGWRMQAADYLAEMIKKKIHELLNDAIINRKVIIDGLGTVSFLRVCRVNHVWQIIDSRYINRLLIKEVL